MLATLTHDGLLEGSYKSFRKDGYIVQGIVKDGKTLDESYREYILQDNGCYNEFAEKDGKKVLIRERVQVYPPKAK